MKEISRTAQKKRGGKWIDTYRTTDTCEVYRSLSHDLINRKLCQCRYITRITRRSNYDGTQTVIVNYDNDVRSVYVVKN